MSISGILGRGNVLRIDADVEVPDEIYDGIETMATVTLRNTGRLPRFLLEISLSGVHRVVKTIGLRETVHLPLPAVFRGRGYQVLEGFEVRSIFPVNFFVRRRTLKISRKVLVFPSPLRCGTGIPSEGGGRGGEAPSHLRGLEGDISRIADYSGVEPLKAIHWKLSARQEELKVKELSAVTQEPVILDPLLSPGKDLETRLRHTTYLVQRFIREGRPVGLKIGNRLVRPVAGNSQKRRLLAELALYDQA